MARGRSGEQGDTAHDRQRERNKHSRYHMWAPESTDPNKPLFIVNVGAIPKHPMRGR